MFGFLLFTFRATVTLQELHNGFKSYYLALVQQEVVIERNKGMAVT